ncbi:autotransporter outer membrane beta-barrel domain-containing protein [Luteolibacter sp. GHJ8]|uniref:Autotransporter outer membrane beta-barrel domain-containing protein n=1 Tax=Luteolibacter rhizosphaerae TaxID=2989719 RepID=A0ABT3G2M8_9BACT|nr:autotransporter outer membrane beta-barrel domain-containing protein [Luteolibacter rhizosphaerae]MCW1913794.1 autotransporter outer membrane beta-barrel domain-containing protein [Luteolibacter rhizosphaerae]
MNTPAAKYLRFYAIAMAAGSLAHAGEFPDPCYPDNRSHTSSAINSSVLGVAWASSHDVGGRLAAHRAGIRPASRLVETPSYGPVSESAKGGMSAKGGAKVSSIAVPVPNKWEVYGSLFFYSEDKDGQSFRGHGKKKYEKDDKKFGFGLAGGSADTTLDVVGGTVGIEHHINREWSVGVGVSAATGDLKMGSAGSADIDSVSVSPYISYYRADAFGSADFWADLMYSYGAHSYDIRRNTGGGIATGSPDANTNTIEFTTGVNFGEENVVHGPYAGLRYITGTVDAYTEFGPGATFFGEQDVDSLVSILGYQISWKMRGSNGFWVPQIRAAWEHEFEDGGNSLFGVPVNTRDEDIAVVGASMSYYFDNGWNLGLEYEGRFGSETEGHYGGIKAGKEF